MPTHLYKVVVGIGADPSQKPSMGAFVVPNTPVHNELTDLATFQVSKDELQVLTGFNFLPELSTSETTNLCSTKENACRLRNWKEIGTIEGKKDVIHDDRLIQRKLPFRFTFTYSPFLHLN